MNITNTSADSWVFLNVSYNESGEGIGLVNETTLRIYKYDGSWQLVPGVNGVNQEENYVYANVTSFSVFAPLGEPGVNSPPIFNSQSLNPSRGFTGTNYVFQANFSDANNDPLTVNLSLDGVNYPMINISLGVSSITGRMYEGNVSPLSVGTHSYFFTAFDRVNTTTTGTFSGPTVTSAPVIRKVVTVPDLDFVLVLALFIIAVIILLLKPRPWPGS